MLFLLLMIITHDQASLYFRGGRYLNAAKKIGTPDRRLLMIMDLLTIHHVVKEKSYDMAGDR